MSSLWDSVVNGEIATESYQGGLSAEVEAEIDARVTDDPFTVSEYTGECFYNMMACEAALAMVEGRCAVKYVTATTESAKEEATATMEVSFRGAWEKIKEYAERAWEAIKKFIMAVWKKIKGYAALVKNFFKSNAQAIKQKKLTGLMVQWCKVDVAAVQKCTDSWVTKLKADQAHAGNDTFDIKLINDDFWKDLNVQVYGRDTGYTPVATRAEQVISDAIRCADMGEDKYFQSFLKLGQKKAQDFEKATKQKIDDKDKEIDEAGDSEKGKSLKKLRDCFRAQLNVIKYGTTALRQAVSHMYSQSVKACRAAIRYQAGDRSASAKESYDFSSVLSEIM